MRAAEQAIANVRTAYFAQTAAAWRGFEREFVIELVRGLDDAAFAFTMAPNRAHLVAHDQNRHYILRGAASALRPFLETMRNDAGGVPWGPTSQKWSAAADQHLMNSGRLATLQRFAALERYGLAEVSFRADDHIVIDVAPDTEESTETYDGAKLSRAAKSGMAVRKRQLARLKPNVATRLDAYVSIKDGWSIEYDTDEELIAYHQEFARILAVGTAEAGALPAAALLGGRSFEQWNDSSLTALGGILHHVAFATRLKATTTPGLELRNLLTVFARKDDIAAVWQGRGESACWADRVIAGLTLNAESAAQCERDHEVPLPYYIDFGRDFLLLPIFGGLMNPYAGLVWHLRRNYRADWDKAVDGREAIFRSEIQQLFPPPRYSVPTSGFRLRRMDGSDLTDVDAVVLDRDTGELVLIQLKWPDIYGSSLAERNSRRLNLLKANEWVASVCEWLGSRTNEEVAAYMGIKHVGPSRPVLLVLARHAARFAGESGYDPRAIWMSWPNLVEACRERERRHVGIVSVIRGSRNRSPRDRVFGAAGLHYLPGLTVEIRIADPSS